jgi:hypothetical protein
MANTAISAATLTTPRLTDWVPLARTSDTTVRKAAVGALGVVQVVTVNVSAAAVSTLFSSPVTIIPAQGAGTVITVVGALLQWVAGTQTYSFDPNGGGSFFLSSLSQGVAGNVFPPPYDPSFVTLGPGETTIEPIAASENVPLLLSMAVDYGNCGPVTSSTVGTPGASYQVNDTGTLNAGATPPTWTITSVDGGGGVTGFTLSSPGAGLISGTYATTATSGSGDNTFTINAVVDGPIETGHASITVAYVVLPALT